VYCVILRARLTLLLQRLELRAGDVINCMMIDAEMYGMIPSAKIVKRDSAPPENMLNMPRMPPCCLEQIAQRSGVDTRHGMCAPIRYTTSAPSRNQQPALQIAELPAFADWLPGLVAKKSPSCQLVIRHAAASGFDRAFAPLVAPTPLSDDLAVISPDRTTFADNACCGTIIPACFSVSRSISSTGSVQFGQANFDVTGIASARQTALRQTTLQRHLTALETDLVETAGTGLLPLVTATAGLAQTAADAATDTRFAWRALRPRPA
jgi:hypothetical protein